jgi:hypothetical protein
MTYFTNFCWRFSHFKFTNFLFLMRKKYHVIHRKKQARTVRLNSKM